MLSHHIGKFLMRLIMFLMQLNEILAKGVKLKLFLIILISVSITTVLS